SGTVRTPCGRRPSRPGPTALNSLSCGTSSMPTPTTKQCSRWRIGSAHGCATCSSPGARPVQSTGPVPSTSSPWPCSPCCGPSTNGPSLRPETTPPTRQPLISSACSSASFIPEGPDPIRAGAGGGRKRPRRSAPVEVGQHRRDPAAGRLTRMQAELVEDRADGLLHGADRHEQPFGDPAIRQALGHRLEHFVLPRCEGSQGILLL